MTAVEVTQAFCSARLLQPFLSYMSRYAEHQDVIPAKFRQSPLTERVSVEEAHEMLARGTATFNEP